MKSFKRTDAKLNPLPSRLKDERNHLYTILHVWDDEDTQVSKSVSMADLVNGGRASEKATDVLGPLCYRKPGRAVEDGGRHLSVVN